MHNKHLFEYAVIRVIPKVHREEFINVGVILFCRDLRFLQAMFTLPENRLLALCSDIDLEEVRIHLCAFEHICNGDAKGGPIAALDMASRFRWLTATRSTIVQASKVHPGLCIDPKETLLKLHTDLVL